MIVKLFCMLCAPSNSLPAENETGKWCENCGKWRASEFVEYATLADVASVTILRACDGCGTEDLAEDEYLCNRCKRFGR